MARNERLHSKIEFLVGSHSPTNTLAKVRKGAKMGKILIFGRKIEKGIGVFPIH